MARKNKKPRHTMLHYFFTIIKYLIKGIIGSFVWLVIGYIGLLIFQTKQSPYDKIIGLPLMLIGAGLTGNTLFSFILSIFSPSFNRGVCSFCNGKEED